MAKVSHARCRECGQTRHRNAKFNLCRQCWNKRKPKVKAGWRDIKARRAAKRTPNGAVHETEGELIVAAAVDLVLEEEHTPVPRGRAPSLTPEQEAEIVNLYTTTETPVTEIAETYGLGHTQPFRILSKHGVTWRRGDGRELPPHIAAMSQVHVAPDPTPAPQEEPEPVPEPKPTPEQSERMAPAAEIANNGQVEMSKWGIEFRGKIIVSAANAADAIREAEKGGYGVRDIELVRRLS